MADEIIEEVWRIKDEISREHGCDVGRLGAYYLRLGRERVRGAEEGAAAGEGTAGQRTGPGRAEAVGWVQTEFGGRQGGGSDRSGS